MSAPKVDKTWVQARVHEYGSILASKPEGVSHKVWSETCRALGVTARKRDVALEEALKELAARAAA